MFISKRVLIVIVILWILQFAWFSLQIDQVKRVVTSNAAIANKKSSTNIAEFGDLQGQINDVRDAVKLVAQHVAGK